MHLRTFIVGVSCIVILICIASDNVNGLDNGLVRTPPMGWMAWERFRCVTDCETFPDDCISEKLFMDMADRMAADGWRDAGYEYINIDDCWMAMERVNGSLVGDPKRFPHGIKYLADYIHSKGLKFGIYEDYGTKTCGGYPGSEGYESVDAKTFADWGVDYLKFDGCYSNATAKRAGYPLMGKALNATGRPIAYSCSWPAYLGGLPPKVNYTELEVLCNLWRNYGDIQDSWSDVLDIVDWWGTNQDVLVAAAGPGHFNDPDMIIVGDYALSYDQSKVQFGMWAILAAPLFMSNDLRTISDEAKSILQNKYVIAINQDAAGIQGKRYINSNSKIQGWSRPLERGQFAVAILSTRTDGFPHKFTFTLSQLNITTSSHYMLYDVYDGKPAALHGVLDDITLYLNPNGIKMYFVAPTSLRRRHNEDMGIL